MSRRCTSHMRRATSRRCASHMPRTIALDAPPHMMLQDKSSRSHDRVYYKELCELPEAAVVKAGPEGDQVSAACVVCALQCSAVLHCSPYHLFCSLYNTYPCICHTCGGGIGTLGEVAGWLHIMSLVWWDIPNHVCKHVHIICQQEQQHLQHPLCHATDPSRMHASTSAAAHPGA